MKLDYVGRLGKRENRECVYQFVTPDDERDSIFRQWLNRDEALQSELVSVNLSMLERRRVYVDLFSSSDCKPCNPQRTSDLSPSDSRFYVF
ncbi:hypothetical protein [Nostoc sp. NZL]|uniref:hypothetical protein n=1 Tax=Nostoc sp. NZL TaxID=2650612 RepID=UPI0018C50F7E|nr:hypothetical protein [Nostoc sp. NZL]MBG1242473.1 hypothetical protein [Nostoc sp. NZL]